MSELQRFLGAAVIGIGGAALIAALVLGRGEQRTPEYWSAFAGGGGVIHAQVEEFVRADPSRRDTRGLPERRVRETWILMDVRRGVVEMILVTHSPEGELLERGRSDGGRVFSAAVPERPVRDWPEPGSESVSLTVEGGGSEEFRQRTEEWAEQQGLQVVRGGVDGNVMLTGVFPPGQIDTGVSAITSGYTGDLDAVEIEVERVLNEAYLVQSVVYRAVLEDGSRVVIESQRMRYSLLPRSEWGAVEELVFGE